MNFPMRWGGSAAVRMRWGPCDPAHARVRVLVGMELVADTLGAERRRGE
jgi:hypothetical protein